MLLQLDAAQAARRHEVADAREVVGDREAEPSAGSAEPRRHDRRSHEHVVGRQEPVQCRAAVEGGRRQCTLLDRGAGGKEVHPIEGADAVDGELRGQFDQQFAAAREPLAQLRVVRSRPASARRTPRRASSRARAVIGSGRRGAARRPRQPWPPVRAGRSGRSRRWPARSRRRAAAGSTRPRAREQCRRATAPRRARPRAGANGV